MDKQHPVSCFNCTTTASFLSRHHLKRHNFRYSQFRQHRQFMVALLKKEVYQHRKVDLAHSFLLPVGRHLGRKPLLKARAQLARGSTRTASFRLSRWRSGDGKILDECPVSNYEIPEMASKESLGRVRYFDLATQQVKFRMSNLCILIEEVRCSRNNFGMASYYLQTSLYQHKFVVDHSDLCEDKSVIF